MLIALRILDWLLVPLAIVALAYEPNFAHGALNYNESGQHLAAIGSMQRGELLFRDIFVQYGPLHYYVPLWLFDHLGHSLATLRGYFLSGEIAGLVAAYGLARQLLSTRTFAVLAGLVIAMEAHHPFWSTRWGGWRFFFVYVALAAMLRFSDTRKPGWMLAAGLSSALAFLHTYDAAAAAGLGALVFFVLGFSANRHQPLALFDLRRGLTYFLSGFVACALPFLIHLLATGTLGDYLGQLPFSNAGRVWLQPFTASDITPSILAPGLIFALSLALLGREVLIDRWGKGDTIPLAMLIASGGILYLASFRAIRGPQFESSLPIAIILTAYWLSRAYRFFETFDGDPTRRIQRLAAFAALCGVPLALGMGEIRTYAGGAPAWWHYQVNKEHLVPRYIGADRLDEDYRVIAVERAGSARVPRWQAEEIEGLTRYLRGELEPEDPLFAYPDLGIFNYFADKPHITRFQIPILAAADKGWSGELMHSLENEPPPVVLLGTRRSTLSVATRHSGEYLPEAGDFVRENYQHAGRIGRVDIFRHPAPELAD
ncbi:MAG: hypothetical protein NZ990_10420 [Myxococcota bacterium]|nr:hypothetical protein [Myxococcota bacterium]